MAVSNVTSTTAAVESAQSLQKKQSTLDQDAFLKLLVAQLTYQDPMNPVNNQDFSAQMAQFSSLEEIMSMNKNLKSLYVEQSVAEAAALMGKNVYGTDTAGQEASGNVRGVSIKDGIPYLQIADNQFMSLYNVVTIEPVAGQGA